MAVNARAVNYCEMDSQQSLPPTDIVPSIEFSSDLAVNA